MFPVNVLLADAEALSVTIAVKLNAPALVGEPLMTPDELMFTPAGSAPLVMDHVYGAVPPDASNVTE
jgi:hypothetical protein